MLHGVLDGGFLGAVAAGGKRELKSSARSSADMAGPKSESAVKRNSGSGKRGVSRKYEAGWVEPIRPCGAV